jgi:hypothetical protein
MPVRWKMFRIICLLQLLLSSFFTITAIISFFEAGGFSGFIRMILFLFILLLAIIALSILNNNYPDVPVTGKQKTNFNRLFLVNFLFLAFLFGIIIAEYREAKSIAVLLARPFFTLPFELFIPLLMNIVTLVFQFIILYGLYHLRRELYVNFMKKEFEFEKNQSG